MPSVENQEANSKIMDANDQERRPNQKSITYISDGVLAPGTRFRVDPIMRALEKRGWEGRSICGYGEMDQKIGSATLKRGYRISCRLWRALRTALLNPPGPIFMQRLAIPIWGAPEARLAKRSQSLVFDFDDAIFMDAQHQLCKKRQAALNRIYHAAAHVVAGNSWLASHVPDGIDVTIIPTCLDTDKYTPDPEPNSDSLNIGWMGTSSNFQYLHQLVEPLARLREKYPEMKFIICSDEQNANLFQQTEAEFVKWTPETEVDILRSFDVGLMPLSHEDWCRGKCSFKLIQYMSVGIPTVSTSVGMNLDVVDHEVDGLFAVDDDWYSALDTLLADADLRQRMGAAARKTAVKKFSLEIAVAAYQKIFEDLI